MKHHRIAAFGPKHEHCKCRVLHYRLFWPCVYLFVLELIASLSYAIDFTVVPHFWTCAKARRKGNSETTVAKARSNTHLEHTRKRTKNRLVFTLGCCHFLIQLFSRIFKLAHVVSRFHFRQQAAKRKIHQFNIP